MGTWIELRCDDQRAEGCLSTRGIDPMEMACDSRSSLLTTMRIIEDQARKTGWKKINGGWTCPICVNKQ